MLTTEATGPRRTRTILVVDDDAVVREVLADALTGAGYKVLQCEDGRQVVSTLEKTPADLMVTDIFMREGDGLEAITNVRRTWPQMKIIAMSAGARMTRRDFLPVAEKLGADRILRKPIDVASFLMTVRELLATSSTD